MARRGAQFREQAFRGFLDGVNNVYREDNSSPQMLREARNVDILEQGRVTRRSGYTKLLSLDNARSLHIHNGTAYYAEGGELHSCNLTTLETAVVAPVHPTKHISYTDLNGFLVFSDGESTLGRIGADGAALPLALPTPNTQPVLAATGLGRLPVGRYQVTLVYLRGREESGACEAAAVDLSAAGGITVSGIPVPPGGDIDGVRVYMTNPSGARFYRARDISAGTTMTTLSEIPHGKELETQFLDPLPPGDIVRLYNGRLYSARGRFIYASHPLRFGLYDKTQDYIELASKIDMLEPNENGLYVGAGKRTYFYLGNRLDELDSRIVYAHGVVPGTPVQIPASTFSFEALKTGNVVVWWATSGVMVVGFPQGQISIVREGEFALPEYSHGSIMLREAEGKRQLVSTLQEPKSDSTLTVSDSVSATVYRNGIEI